MRMPCGLPFALAVFLGVACSPAPVAEVADPAAAKADAPRKPAADRARPAAVGKTSPTVAMFGGTPSRNLVNLTDRDIPDDFDVGLSKGKGKGKGKEKHILWKADLGGKAYGGPVIAGGKVFVGTNNERPRDPTVEGDRGVLMCFRESDGTFLWQHTYPKADPLNDSAHDGITSTPCVEGDRLWYVNNRGEFVCSDTDGKVVWKYDMVKELDVFVGQQVYTSPVVVGDLVYGLTCNGTDAHGKLHRPKAPSLVALDKKTGKLAWTNALPGDRVMRGQWSNPTAATVNGKTQVIYGGGDGWLYGLDARSGDLAWKFDCNPKSAPPFKPSGERSYIIATPVVHENRCYVATGHEPDETGIGHLWCVDITKAPTNKERDLSPVGDNFDPRAKVNAGSGLVWHYGGLVKPKPKDDEREFVFGRTLSTVAVHDGLVYAAEIAGLLHCIDAKTGVKQWEHDFVEATWASPYYVDGKVFLGLKSGDLTIFRAGRKYAAPKKIRTGSPIDVQVVVVNGVLYVNNGKALYAIKK